MRHLTAVHVELESGTGWHFASVGKTGGGPIGTCAEHPPHLTESEARQCYRRYERSLIRLDGECSWTSCAYSDDSGRCPDPANHYAQAGPYHIAALCSDHLTIGAATQALGLGGDQAGDSWVS